MMEAPTTAERIRAFVAERTGVSREQIDAVIEAVTEFWAQYPDALEMAREMSEEIEGRAG